MSNRLGDFIELSRRTADALSSIPAFLGSDAQGDGAVQMFLSAERAAWIVLVLRRLEDRPEWFPLGKWATIQAIEAQLDGQADEAAKATEVA